MTADDITLDTLMPYREFMTIKQLERYGDYLAHREIQEPFTWDEIEKLASLKEEATRKKN